VNRSADGRRGLSGDGPHEEQSDYRSEHQRSNGEEVHPVKLLANDPEIPIVPAACLTPGPRVIKADGA
jgi:hypothetical protein